MPLLSPSQYGGYDPRLVNRVGSETVTSVLGITGSKVALPCNITPPVQDDAVALILWYKDDITKPIYSVDARKTSVDQARHVTGQAVSSRVSLSLEDNPSMLYLEFLTEEDEGEYRCRVDFRRARSRNGIVFLQLVEGGNLYDGNLYKDLILPRAPKPKRHLMDLLRAVYLYAMATASFAAS
ncbi:ig-like domain-containing protein [Trichonephila clavipes]|nr:ig-like domain-containing protein [Trichonephila clavipes]